MAPKNTKRYNKERVGRSARGSQPLVGAVAVAGHHPVQTGTQQRTRDDAAPRPANVTDGDQGRYSDPQPGALVLLSPTGLIQIGVLGLDIFAQFFNHRIEGFRGFLFQVAKGAWTDRDRE